MPELRHDPVQKQWVIIATDRGRRPQDFRPPITDKQPKFCPFCKGHEERVPNPIRIMGKSGAVGEADAWLVKVVPNKFPALKVEGGLDRKGEGVYDAMNGVGAHEVVIETPQHDQQLADLPIDHFTLLLDVYRERLEDLLRDVRLRYIMIFKNYGEDAGATLPHPHSQVIATPVTPHNISSELRSARDHYHLKERCLFCDILHQEITDGSRLVTLNEHFVAFCPYASKVPFEVHIYPRHHAHDYSQANSDVLHQLAATLKDVLRRMRISLEDPPYNLMLHTSPNISSGKKKPDYWRTLEQDFHWHFELLPRVTRMAGFEWGTGIFINPTAPEEAARYLREVQIGGTNGRSGQGG